MAFQNAIDGYHRGSQPRITTPARPAFRVIQGGGMRKVPGRNIVPGISGTRAIRIAQQGGPARQLARHLGRRLPFFAAGKKIYDAIHQQQGSPLPAPDRAWNPAWEPAGCNGPESVCEQGSMPDFFTNENTFCWQPEKYNGDNLINPQEVGMVVYGWKYFWRCDLRGTEYEWYGYAPVVKRTVTGDFWLDPAIRDFPWNYVANPSRGPVVHPDMLPEAQPIQQPQPHPQKRPYWARPARLPDAVIGREEGPVPVVRPRTQRDPLPHVKRRPKKREKERKPSSRGILGAILSRALFITELKDALEAVADGLGFNKKITVTKCYGGRCITYQKRVYDKNMSYAQFIYQRWSEATTAELQQAMLNVLYNEMEDQLVGRLSRKLVVPGVGTLRNMGNTWVLDPWQ